MEFERRQSVVVLGAGPSGLCAAYNLVDQFDVTILEKSDQVAGLASCFRYQGKTIPKYYHHIFEHDHLTRKYFEILTDTKDLRWARIKVGICANRRVYSFSDPISLLQFDYLSPFGRFRYGLFGVYVLYLMDPSKVPDSLDAEQWLLTYAGREVTDKIFFQLYARNKFNIPLSEISARQFAHRLKAKEVMGVFGFPRKGLHTLFEGFERHLERNRCRISKSVGITRVDLNAKVVYYDDADRIPRELSYDVLVNTIPTPEFLKVQEGLPADYVTRIGEIRYCPVVSVVFGADRHLSEHYWLNVFNERAQIIMQHSLLNDDFNHKISWVSRYGGSEEDLELPDEQIEESYLKDVKKFFPDINVSWSRVFKERYAEPIYDKEYFAKMPNYRTPVKGLYFAGIAITYPEIRNINTALKSGETVARAIAEDMIASEGASRDNL
jgi:protoporphyrinogen oxidase